MFSPQPIAPIVPDDVWTVREEAKKTNLKPDDVLL